jgi:hypothetical protein
MSTLLSPIQRALAARTRVSGGRPEPRASSSSDLLDPYIQFEALGQGMKAVVYQGPYGAVLQEAQPASSPVAHEPDLTLLLLR